MTDMTPQRKAAIAMLDNELDPAELADYLAYLDAVDDGRADSFGADEIAPFAVAEDAE